MQFKKNAIYYIQDESIYSGVTNTDLVFDGNGATLNVISADRDNIGSYSLNGQLLTAAQFATRLADGTLPPRP